MKRSTLAFIALLLALPQLHAAPKLSELASRLQNAPDHARPPAIDTTRREREALAKVAIFASQLKWSEAVDSIQPLATPQCSAKIDYALGQALQGMKETEQAIESFRKAVRKKPNFAQAHQSIGNLLLTLENPDYSAAIESLLWAREGGMTQPSLYAYLGEAYFKLEMWPEAERVLLDGLKLRPNDRKIKAYLDYAQKIQGKG